MSEKSLWYKDAIFYEIRIRSFFDSIGDGMGDFSGLTQKLDYLQDLGVTALWLLPFYPSPLRDDGYDIADYRSVHPDCGTLTQFKEFVREAHGRGLRVVTELVLNHTSDQHPWFQKARRPGPGNRWRDFYVWNDSPERFRDARVIFKDFEPSNWTWDPLARSYFWHRFFAHQPDLNFDNPRVRRSMFQVVDFWLRMGVDGLRLDAVPYLFEREGTNCENLPETHAFLRELRSRIDSKFSDRMLLAEANQWPEDAIAYFGQGDECNMAFHFPIMPRLFSALQMEDRFPVIDILAQTPQIPETCQWALFLRNHDELTLEMVTDEERDYMYRVYAQDAHMRVNLGIRRRLAPLLSNSRRKIELMNNLLFSLPGTPVIYYGDEIGMGDNYFLGDRNGVRTPMQWSGDRNAGFSRANPHRLYLPVVIDPEYHYETVNVEALQGNPHSLLWWMKRLIALRKQYKAFGRGTLGFLYPSNPKVLAFLRRHGDELLLVVTNLSRFSQYAELDLSAFQGRTPVELFGRTEFPPIRKHPYLLTLSPHAFYWFALEKERRPAAALVLERDALPPLEAEGEPDRVLEPELRTLLESRLPAYLASRSWFQGKSRTVRGVRIVEDLRVPLGGSGAQFLLVQVEYGESQPETYVLPIAFASGERAEKVKKHAPASIISRVILRGPGGAQPYLLYDAVSDPAFCLALSRAVNHRKMFGTEYHGIRAVATEDFRHLWSSYLASPERSTRTAEQNNTAIFYGEQFILKLFRRVEEGVRPGLEVGRFLEEHTGFRKMPPLAGYLDYRKGRRVVMTLGVLHRYVPNQGTAWRHTLDALGRTFDAVVALTKRADAPLPPSCPGHLLELAAVEPPAVVRDLLGGYLESVRLLGRYTAELHLALTSAPDVPEFAPEPFSLLYQRSLYQSMRNLTGYTMQLLKQRLETVPPAVVQDARKLLDAEKLLHKSFAPLRTRKMSAMRTRYHGNLCLSEILYTGKDFVFIDLEGEPSRSLSDHRIKRSPLRDVASMLRSFHYAAYCTLVGPGASTVARPEDLAALEPWLEVWYRVVSAAFLKAYLSRRQEMTFLPASLPELELLLDTLLLERALRELGTELLERPDWVGLPLRGIAQILWPQG